MKIIIISFVLILTLPVFLQAQYMGGNGNGNATIALTNVPIFVNRIAVELPAKYELYQNYPNPFNPITIIHFDLLKPGKVILSVFDITGKELVTLINDYLPSGYYETSFNASTYSSGVYFYKLETNTFSETKKMTILK